MHDLCLILLLLAALVRLDHRGPLTRPPHPSLGKSSILPFQFVNILGRKPATGEFPTILICKGLNGFVDTTSRQYVASYIFPLKSVKCSYKYIICKYSKHSICLTSQCLRKVAVVAASDQVSGEDPSGISLTSAKRRRGWVC